MTREPYSVIFIIIAAVIIMGAILYFTYLANKKRREALALVADDLGFDFSPKGDETFLASLREFHLFSRGHSRRITNLMYGRVQGIDVALFDYTFVTGGGKHSHTHFQTVVCFESAGQRWPDFSLRPGFVVPILGPLLGQHDIDFESHPAFSSRYLLQGNDQAAIRQLFTPQVLDYYEAHPGLCTEGGGERLLIYRQSKRVAPELIQSFLQEGLDILAMFRLSVRM